MRGLLDDVASGRERGFAVDALDGVGGRVELALEEALLDVLLGEVFVADDLAFAGELLGVGGGLVEAFAGGVERGGGEAAVAGCGPAAG